MAKSVLDAGWHILKTMLGYKCDHAGVVFKEVNESYTTQGAVPHMTVILTLLRTFSRSGMGVSREESPSYKLG